MQLVEGAGPGPALVTRFHHSLADGVALAQVLLALTDATPDGDTGPGDDGALLLSHGRPRPRRPRLAPAALPGTVLRTVDAVRKLTVATNPRTTLSRRPGVSKRLAWSPPYSLDDVRRVARLVDGTVNDVVVALVSAAVSDHLQEHDGRRVDLTTMVPVDLRPGGRPLPSELGNRFALVFLPLPTGSWTLLQRLSEAHRRMAVIKGSPEAAMTFALTGGVGLLHRRLERPVVDFFASKAFGVTTNVVGPREVRYLAGSPVSGVLGWVPGSGGQTLGTCVVTYAGTLRVGFLSDAGAVPDPTRLVAAFEDALARLLRMANSG
jgi:WS/DGAT/MGAT family acyltransferase